MKKYRYVILGIFVLSIIATLIEPSYLSFHNMINILRQSSILFLLSLGLTIVVLTGNIDLSVGSVAALTGCICAKLMVSGHPIGLAVLCSITIGLVTGLCNGFLVGVLRLPSFVASYGMNMVVSGLALIVMNGGIIYDLPESFTFWGIGYVGVIPMPIILGIILFLIYWGLIGFTTYGRNVYMIGQNKIAAIYSGIDSFRIMVSAFILCGLSASIGGVIMTARLNAADAGMCDAYGLQIVAAVVVGGTSLLGGEGGIPGTVFGSLILTIIINIMNMIGIDSAWQNLVLGALIIMLVLLNRWGISRVKK